MPSKKPRQAGQLFLLPELVVISSHSLACTLSCPRRLSLLARLFEVEQLAVLRALWQRMRILDQLALKYLHLSTPSEPPWACLPEEDMEVGKRDQRAMLRLRRSSENSFNSQLKYHHLSTPK